MKKFTLFMIAGCIWIAGNSQVSGTKTIPGNYPTITAAIQDIGIQGLGGAVVLELQPGYVSNSENFPIVIGPLTGSSATNTLTISPATGSSNLQIQSTVSGPAMELSAAAHLIIDGRPGRTGTAIALTISNMSNDGSALRLSNGANNNLITYCHLASGDFLLEEGVVTFTNTTGAAVGNTNNTISFCRVEGAIADVDPPFYGIYAIGIAAGPNANNSILNNEIFNFAIYGIRIEATGNGGGWTISGNSIFNELNVSSQTGRVGIDFRPGTAANDNVIAGNFIGGQAPLAGAPKWVHTGDDGKANFTGIFLKAGTGSGTAVQNNVIKNISPTQSSVRVTGIVIENGAVQVSNNLIGGTSAADNTVLTGGPSNTVVEGIISYSCFPVSITDNTISHIVMAGNELQFIGIGRVPFSNTTISGNQIFQVDASGTGPVDFVAIGFIENLLTACANPIAPSVIDENLINNLTIDAGDGDASLRGIVLEEAGVTAEKNEIGQINVSGSTSSFINGIVYTGSGTANISENTLLALSSPVTTAIMVQPGTGNSNVTVNKNTVTGTGTSAGTGIAALAGSGASVQLTVIDNAISAWQTGLLAPSSAGGSLTLNLKNNIITGNGTGVVNNSGTPVDATCNWWGNATGPSGAGPGTGDPVGANVLFNPWATIPGFISVNAGTDQTITLGFGSPSVTLTATAVSCGAPTFAWSTGQSGASIIVSPTVTTTYTITATDANGHEATDAVIVNVVNGRCGTNNEKRVICHKNKNTLCLLASELATHLAHGDTPGACSGTAPAQALILTEKSAGLLVAYPNPSRDNLQLEWDAAAAGTAQLRFIDILGRVADLRSLPETLGRNSRQVSLQNIRAGNYFLVLQSGNRIYTTKITRSE
jgi:hypothetical protein